MSNEALQDRFCLKPFESLGVEYNGNAYVCCHAWLPLNIGNIKRLPLNEIWNSAVVKRIRESIIDGSFSFCDHKNCPDILNGTLPLKSEVMSGCSVEMSRGFRFLNFAGDLSCNLNCPACALDEVPQEVQLDAGILKKTNKEILDCFLVDLERVVLLSSGELFSSLPFLDFLLLLNGSKYPNLKIEITTNGLLLDESMWMRLEKNHSNIEKIIVSVDAATAETYSLVKGGDFSILMENIGFLSKLRHQKKLDQLEFTFLVQADNYHELSSFCKMAKDRNIEKVVLKKVCNWGRLSSAEYAKMMVHDPSHPEFSKFVGMLKKVRGSYSSIVFDEFFEIDC